MDLNLAGKTALITGGGSGLGLATAKNLNKEEVKTIILQVLLKMILSISNLLKP